MSRKPTLVFDGHTYVRLDSGQYIPKAVTDELATPIPTSLCRRQPWRPMSNMSMPVFSGRSM